MKNSYKFICEWEENAFSLSDFDLDDLDTYIAINFK